MHFTVKNKNEQTKNRKINSNWLKTVKLIYWFLYWRRKWQPTPVLLPGESQGQGSLVGCQPWGRTEPDTTEATQQQHTGSQGWIWVSDLTISPWIQVPSFFLLWYCRRAWLGLSVRAQTHDLSVSWSSYVVAGFQEGASQGFFYWSISVVAQMVKNLPAMWDTMV